MPEGKKNFPSNCETGPQPTNLPVRRSKHWQHREVLQEGVDVEGRRANSAVVVGPGGPLAGPNYIIAGAGGDLTKAARIDFYENGLLAGGFAVPANGPQGLNNWWTNIQLTGPPTPPIAEPGAMSLLGLGALGLRATRRRK